MCHRAEPDTLIAPDYVWHVRGFGFSVEHVVKKVLQRAASELQRRWRGIERRCAVLQ